MKNSALLIIASLLFLCMCTQRQTLNSSCEFTLDAPIAAIVDSFTSINKGYKVYELYIDKKDPHKAILVIFAGERAFVEMENQYEGQESIINVLSNGVWINVYSGVERYVKKTILTKKSRVDFIDPKGVFWVITDDFRSLTIEDSDTYSVYPFMILPRKGLEFTPPDVMEVD